jgi:hypothetical protein
MGLAGGQRGPFSPPVLPALGHWLLGHDDSPENHDDVMHVLGEFDRLPVGNYLLGGAQMNYVGIDHYRQYSHLTVMRDNNFLFC